MHFKYATLAFIALLIVAPIPPPAEAGRPSWWTEQWIMLRRVFTNDWQVLNPTEPCSTRQDCFKMWEYEGHLQFDCIRGLCRLTDHFICRDDSDCYMSQDHHCTEDNLCQLMPHLPPHSTDD